MPQTLAAIENNFTKGLITEATGLNFPENAATDTDNCTYTLVGNVTRRLGIDIEENGVNWGIYRENKAVSTFTWTNAGGDGNTQLLVTQFGRDLRFWVISDVTVAAPLSTHQLSGLVDISTYTALGAAFDPTIEATYASGNGYLFVYHPNCDPLYCSYDAGVVHPHVIDVQIRDFTGVVESPVNPINFRPVSLSPEHNYNLTNQGWTSGDPWSAISSTFETVAVNPTMAFTVPAGITGSTPGDVVSVYYIGPPGPGLPPNGPGVMVGTLSSYVGTTMTLNITSIHPPAAGTVGVLWQIIPTNKALLDTWFGVEKNYPSNADVWWRFKNASGVFDPTTQAGVSLSVGQAPQGHFITNAFNQNKSGASGVAGITPIVTIKRPTIGTWFQGRVWYAGVNDSQQATGDAPYYTWSENIYFSQINVGTANNFGNCYQVNDPTSENLFGLLPTDGGIIQIPGSGRIYKLFPIQNGLLVFAHMGVWFITGSQGIGFAANDYTIVPISSVQSISSTSFVNVLGLPYFWNEEGIYKVAPQQQGGLAVEPITVGTIQTFYDSIPRSSKQYVRGAYNPVDYVIQWIFKDTVETDVSDRYTFNRILNFNTYNQAFYPYSTSIQYSSINGISYIPGLGNVNSPDGGFKYLCSNTPVIIVTNVFFADEHDTNYRDWSTTGFPTHYTSYFVTGYKIHGQGQRRFQIPYIYVFSKADEPTSYYIQGLWDYAISGNSGRWSTRQYVINDNPDFSMIFKRHKLRGRGIVLQIKFTSVEGKPFDIMGWSIYETQNAGV